VAEPGQIIVSETTLNQLRGLFTYDELPPANLKGKEKPFRRFIITSTKAMVDVPESLTLQQKVPS
jgi:adenylate cyclase